MDFVSDINQVNNGFQLLHERLKRNEKSFAQIHLHYDESKSQLQDFKAQFKYQAAESGTTSQVQS